MGGWASKGCFHDTLNNLFEHQTDGTPGLKWNAESAEAPIQFTGWGCEFGNWLGFYSSDLDSGVRARTLDTTDVRTSERINLVRDVLLPEAKNKIEMTYFETGDRIDRTLKLTAGDSGIAWMGDAVLRTVVDAKAWTHAWVEGPRYSHENLNRYIETEDQSVHVGSSDGCCLEFFWNSEHSSWPPAFTRYLYVRDQPGDRPMWVVHARLVCEQPAEYVYRLTKGRGVFWSNGFLGRLLASPSRLWRRWRAAEFGIGGRGALNGVWPMAAGTDIEMSMSLKLVRCDRHADDA